MFLITQLMEMIDSVTEPRIKLAKIREYRQSSADNLHFTVFMIKGK